MPFRAVPQDTSYAFLRGVNTSDVFWQDQTAAKDSGFWLEPTAATCTDNTVKLSASKTNSLAADANQWGFKEHPLMYNYFYIYNRWTSRKACTGRWLQAKVTAAECKADSALALAPYYGDDTLWTLIRHHGEAPYTPGFTATPAWDGNPYTWVGTYTIRSVAKGGYGSGAVCTITDLGVDKATSALKWFDPKATTGGASATNSHWNINNLHPMLFATTHFTWQ